MSRKRTLYLSELIKKFDTSSTIDEIQIIYSNIGHIKQIYEVDENIYNNLSNLYGNKKVLKYKIVDETLYVVID